jgi:hypothetical protein
VNAPCALMPAAPAPRASRPVALLSRPRRPGGSADEGVGTELVHRRSRDMRGKSPSSQPWRLTDCGRATLVGPSGPESQQAAWEVT